MIASGVGQEREKAHGANASFGFFFFGFFFFGSFAFFFHLFFAFFPGRSLFKFTSRDR